MGWATEELNRQLYSQNLCKNSEQRRDEDVVFVHGPWSRVRQQAFQSYLKKKQIHFLTAQNQETESSITERLIRTLWSRIWRYFRFKDTSTCFQIFTTLQCNISSQHKTKSSQTAITQPTHDCAANRSSLSNGAVQLTSRCKQILLPPLNFFFATQVLLCSFASWKCFQVCRYITLDKLLFQICVVVLHFVKVNTRIFL